MRRERLWCDAHATVSAHGNVTVAVAPTPNPDGCATRGARRARGGRHVRFEWALGVASSTVRRPYLSAHETTPSLRYASGYVEIVGAADRPSLISFASSDATTLGVTSTGQLKPQRNSDSLTPVSVSATFCDGSVVGPTDLYVNLERSTPFDYDIGQALGVVVPYSPGDAQVCIPISLYSASVLSQFQFVLRFESELLRCSSSSCGTFTPGTDWEAFGTKAAMSTDAGQIDFATVASVSSLARTGSLDIGQICMDVIGSGTLQLRVQMKVHIDAGGTRSGARRGRVHVPGGHALLQPHARGELPDRLQRRRCVLPPEARGGSARGAPGAGAAASPRPMNIDSDADQLTMADCLHLTSVQQQLAGFQAATQTFLAPLDPQEAISYNPNLDFYPGSATPSIDSQDAVYCINYVMKRWRFVYNVSLGCEGGSAVVSLDLAGGKVGEMDQAEYRAGTGAGHADQRERGRRLRRRRDEHDDAALSAGATSPFSATIATGCVVSLASYKITLTNTEGVFSTQMPWPDSAGIDRRLRPWDDGPSPVQCVVSSPPPPSSPPSAPPPSPPQPSPPPPSPSPPPPSPSPAPPPPSPSPPPPSPSPPPPVHLYPHPHRPRPHRRRLPPRRRRHRRPRRRRPVHLHPPPATALALAAAAPPPSPPPPSPSPRRRPRPRLRRHRPRALHPQSRRPRHRRPTPRHRCHGGHLQRRHRLHRRRHRRRHLHPLRRRHRPHPRRRGTRPRCPLAYRSIRPRLL